MFLSGFTQPSVDGHQDCCHFIAISSDTAELLKRGRRSRRNWAHNPKILHLKKKMTGRLSPWKPLANLQDIVSFQAKVVEEAIEGMLLRLEEFCSLTDMIRSDTSQILEENIPLLKAKVTEMSSIYAKVDRLEAFVKMVGHHVSFLEAHVLQAERDHGSFPQVLQRWLVSAGLSSFRNKLSTPAPPPYELPTLYRTEDYFPVDDREVKRHAP
nr:breast carcinoma-amplified sequence 4 isoform X1 [Loxodonta africana]